MKSILKIIVDIFYLFPLRIKKFKSKYPEEIILAYGGCKGIRLDSEEEVERGVNWILARRGFLTISDERIVLGDWIIELNNIEKAEVLMYRSGMILKVEEVGDVYYQFGLQFNRRLLKQDTLKIDVIDSKVKYSMFSVVIRVFIVLNLIYILAKLVS